MPAELTGFRKVGADAFFVAPLIFLSAPIIVKRVIVKPAVCTPRPTAGAGAEVVEVAFEECGAMASWTGGPAHVGLCMRELGVPDWGVIVCHLVLPCYLLVHRPLG